MKTKAIPAIIMLLAGFVTCLAGMKTDMEVADFMKMLLIVLILFYLLGCVVKTIVDKNFMEMKEEVTTDGNMPKEDNFDGEENDEGDERESVKTEDEQ